MKLFFSLLLVCFALVSCNEPSSNSKKVTVSESKPNGFVRVNATIQEYNEIQPWDRKESIQRRGLGALLEDNLILTTSEMVANQVYLELESADGIHQIPAKVVAIDREVNLALLAPETEEETFLKDLKAFSLSKNLAIGDEVETWQLESNGQPTVTKTNIYAVDVVSSYSGGKSIFSYLLKGSLQSASNSYTVPVLSKGMIAGILTSYDSDEQISEVVTSSIISEFLKDAEDGEYLGFPSLGIAASRMPDQSFRDWLGLDAEDGGLYVTRVAKNTAASDGGIEVGDVILAIDGHDLDRKGYYDDEEYGKLIWTHLIRGRAPIGASIPIKIKRDGEIIEKPVTLRKSSPSLIPSEFPAGGPQYFIKGGVIFQQLTKKYLKAYGGEWSSRAPLNLLELYFQSENYEEEFDEAVIITGVIPSQNTVGYESVRSNLVEEVNGVEINRMADLKTGFQSPKDGIHHVKLSESPFDIYLDAGACDQVDQALLQQGIPALSRIHEVE